MTRLLAICLVAILVLGFSFPAVVRADDNSLARATLKGITSVSVLVERLDDDATKIGLTEEVIRTDVELKLRLAGLRVVTDSATIPGNTYLYINVSVLASEAACVNVEFQQTVKLDRNSELAFGVTTWGVGGVHANPTAQGIRNSIKDKVDRFLNAWLSVNPKK